MTRILITTVFIALSAFGNLYSQTFNFLITPAPVFPSPAGPYSVNDSVNYAFVLEHVDSAQVYNDTIMIMQKINNGPAIVAKEYLISNLIQGDTSQGNFDDSLSAAKYGGINVVVIWPSAPFGNVVALDSAKVFDMFIEGITAVEDGFPASRIRLYPNPTSDYAKLEHNLTNYQVDGLELYNIHGQLMYRVDGLPDKVALGHLPEGQYWLRLYFKDGTAEAFRILKQDQ